MQDSDLAVIAPLVVEHYKWISDNGGTDPETLLASPLSTSQRRLLLERMNDVNVLWSITSPLRRTANVREAQQRHSRAILGETDD